MDFKRIRIDAESFASIALLSISASLVFVFLIIRNVGLYPVVFADEWTYSLFSRLAPFSESIVPSYLFLLLFKGTNYCKDGFLECARILNACFFSLALPFIYLICRRVASQRTSIFVALISVLGPVNTYTAYFMPEAMFFFAFWVFTWFVITNVNKKPFILGSGTGTILGLMALIKVHAIFLVPGLFLFLLISSFSKLSDIFLKTASLSFVWAILFFLLTRLLIGYLIAGESGLNLLGGLYGPIASSAVKGDHLLITLQLAKDSLIGHILGLSVLFGLPLAIMAGGSFQDDDKNPTSSDLCLIQIFGWTFLVPLLFVVALFTAHIGSSDPSQSMSRLHMRYYNFIFPLLFILTVAQLSKKNVSHSQRNWLSILPVCVVAVYAVTVGLRNYSPSLTDAPELRGFTFSPIVFLILGWLGIACLIVWAIRREWGAFLYAFVFMPLTMITSDYFVNSELRNRLLPDVYDEAGLFAHRYLGNEASRLAIVASDLGGLFRSLFYIDNPKASIVEIPQGAPLELAKIPAGKTWVLLIGYHPVPPTDRYQIPMGDFSLIKISSAESIDFREERWPGTLTGIRGVSYAEGFGRWSNADEVVMDFVSPLAKKFKLVLNAAGAFGPNVDQPFKIKIGQLEQEFRVGPSPQEVSLIFDCNNIEKTIRIIIPKPVSPKELGMSVDDQRLGIALGQLRIESLEDW